MSVLALMRQHMDVSCSFGLRLFRRPASLLKIARGVHYRWAHPRSEATSLLQLALCLEAEGIQRALCAVGVYHLLDRNDHL